jgi:heme-degrading monooxygenase HmoA
MIDFLTRLEVADFDTWLAVHFDNAASRRSYGMVDGPVYRDIANPNAVMIHTRVEDLDRARQWFQSEASREVGERATIVRRQLYLAQEQQQ